MRRFGWILPNGLVAAGTTVLAGLTAFGPIAEDVSSRTAERLKAEGRAWAKITVDGRDLTLAGTAPDPEQRILTAESADRVFGVRIVTDTSTVLPFATPYPFTVERTASGVTLTGAVPSEAARAALRAAAAKAFPGLAITDETATARGAPADWSSRADYALARVAELKAGSFTYAGDEVTIEGDPLDYVTWEELEHRLATELPSGVKVVADRLRTPAPQRWTFTATAAGGRLVLEGFLPDAATRDRVLTAATASFPTGVVDRTRIAPGARDGVGPALDFTLSALASLTEGGAEIDPAGYSLHGKPKDWAIYQGLEKTLKAGAPGGMPLVADGLIAPIPVPYRLGITVAKGAAEVDGFVPDAAARDRLLAALKDRFTAVDDRLVVAPGAPSGFVDAVLAVVPSLSRFAEFGFDLSGSEARVKGSAVTAAIGAQILAKIGALLPSGFALAQNAVSVLPPPPQVDAAQCQARLAAAQSGETILFDTGKATLREESIRVLDTLVAASLECLTAHVAVEGHTDSEGEPEANQILSEERARSVVDHLVAGGIAADRLTWAGYGETRPIADNATAEGRRLNRRIEFRVD